MLNMKASSDSEVILKATTDMRLSPEEKIDDIDKSNKDAISKMQTEFEDIGSEFNKRMEGLAKKVENRIKKMIDTEIDMKVKFEIDKEKKVTHKMIQKNEQNIKRIEQTFISTMKEEMGDEIDSLLEHVKGIESDLKQSNGTVNDDAQRKRRNIIKNLEERDKENSKHRMENVLRYLNLRDVHVVSAERKDSKTVSKPGVPVAEWKENSEGQ